MPCKLPVFFRQEDTKSRSFSVVLSSKALYNPVNCNLPIASKVFIYTNEVQFLQNVQCLPVGGICIFLSLFGTGGPINLL